MDEFYGGYNYTSDCVCILFPDAKVLTQVVLIPLQDGTTVSSADNIEDVDEDDVLIIDGLTKRFRLPGWRIAWIVGPKEFIKAIGSCGSYLDGGANVPFQEAAIPMLEPENVRKEMIALQRHFRVFLSLPENFPSLPLSIRAPVLTPSKLRTNVTTSFPAYGLWDSTSKPSRTVLSTCGWILRVSRRRSAMD